jgi:spermidine/putrescine transport system permease protein
VTEAAQRDGIPSVPAQAVSILAWPVELVLSPLSHLVRRYGVVLTTWMVVACIVWILGMVILPDLLMIDLSFRPKLPFAEIGGAKDVYTISNYLTLIYNDIHYAIFFKTIWGSVIVTLCSLFVCYPISYFLAQTARPQQASLFMLMLVIPFWINEILRTFSWYIILAYQGPLNALLLWLGIIDEPIRWLTGNGGVVLGMVYAYILFMLFPLYNAIESLDRNQIEAARDLGAPVWRTHWRVVIPHAKPGIAVGCINVFMLAASSYAVPSILGGPGSRWFTEIIYDWFFDGQNWNQGSAYAFILLVLCIVFITVMMRAFRVSMEDIAK